MEKCIVAIKGRTKRRYYWKEGTNRHSYWAAQHQRAHHTSAWRCVCFYIYIIIQPEDVWSNTLTFHVWPILRNGSREFFFLYQEWVESWIISWSLLVNVPMAQNLTLEKKMKCVYSTRMLMAQWTHIFLTNSMDTYNSCKLQGYVVQRHECTAKDMKWTLNWRTHHEGHGLKLKLMTRICYLIPPISCSSLICQYTGDATVQLAPITIFLAGDYW